MAARSSVNRRASQNIRRMIRRLPEAQKAEVASVFQSEGPVILAYAKASTPKKTGKLRNAITMKFSAKTLRLQIGLLTKKARRELFYGPILEKGRKPQTVRVRRRTASGDTITYSLRVKAMDKSEYDIVFGRVTEFARRRLKDPLKAAWQKAIGRAGNGG